MNEMITYICKTCGARNERKGNRCVCEYCGNSWEIDSSNDIHAVQRANAWTALRDGDFEKSESLFDEIILKEPESYEAYWGKALSVAHITYVTDLNENKKVPTCNNITENSFSDDKNVKKAISLAPDDISESYKKQAEYIDKVRVEWLEKASNEPAYDVFISFKDSDRENGIERTQDSIDAQDLYQALTAEGYNVFFSRVSLRNKVSEQYEPYIYNAIKTAKVMVVFGEKPEYFSSVWVKNEWGRFRTRLENGEKHKNSLVVVYKNCDPGDLPAALRARQCLNASDITFLQDLLRHIKRITDETKNGIRLEKIKLGSAQITKKATTIKAEAIKTREIGEGADLDLEVSTPGMLTLVKTFLSQGKFEDAQKQNDNILFEDPRCAEAILYDILIKSHNADEEALLANISKAFNNQTLPMFNRYFECAGKEQAKIILDALYGSVGKNDNYSCNVLKTILPYKYEHRGENIKKAFDTVTANLCLNAFDILITTLKSDDVDRYIELNLNLIRKLKTKKRFNDARRYIDKVLDVDPGNIKARGILLSVSIAENCSAETMTQNLVDLLKLTDGTKRDQSVISALNVVGSCEYTGERDRFAREAIKYFDSDIKNVSEFNPAMLNIAGAWIKNEAFDQAKYYIDVVASISPEDPLIYYYLCLIAIGATSEENIVKSDILIKDVPEYTKYLASVGDAERLRFIKISDEQQKQMAQRRYEWKLAYDEMCRRRKAKAKRISVFTSFWLIITSALAVALAYLKGRINFDKMPDRMYDVLWPAMLAFFVLAGIYLFVVLVVGCCIAGSTDMSDTKSGIRFWAFCGVILSFLVALVAGIFSPKSFLASWGFPVLIVVLAIWLQMFTSMCSISRKFESDNPILENVIPFIFDTALLFGIYGPVCKLADIW